MELTIKNIVIIAVIAVVAIIVVKKVLGARLGL